MGRKGKKNNFKTFNATNVGEIEAKQKENPVNSEKIKKSPRRHGNPSSENLIPVTEKNISLEKGDVSFTGEEKGGKQDITGTETSVFKINTSENQDDVTSKIGHGKLVESYEKNVALGDELSSSQLSNELPLTENQTIQESQSGYDRKKMYHQSYEKQTASSRNEPEIANPSIHTFTPNFESGLVGVYQQKQEQQDCQYDAQERNIEEKRSFSETLYNTTVTENHNFPENQTRYRQNPDYYHKHQHRSDESSSQNQARRREFTNSEKWKNYNKNDNYQRNFGKNSGDWRHNSKDTSIRLFEQQQGQGYIDNNYNKRQNRSDENSFQNHDRRKSFGKNTGGQFNRNENTQSNHRRTEKHWKNDTSNVSCSDTCNQDSLKDASVVGVCGGNQEEGDHYGQWSNPAQKKKYNNNENYRNRGRNWASKPDKNVNSSHNAYAQEQSETTKKGACNAIRQEQTNPGCWDTNKDEFDYTNAINSYAPGDATNYELQSKPVHLSEKVDWAEECSNLDNQAVGDIDKDKQFDIELENAQSNCNKSKGQKTQDDWNDSGNGTIVEDSMGKDDYWDPKPTRATDNTFKNNKYSKNNFDNSKSNYRKSDSFYGDKRERTGFSRYSDPGSRPRLLDLEDPEYKTFKKEINYSDEVVTEKITEYEKDLFEISEEYSLGHCVASDMRMGSGIAVHFKRKFNGLGRLLSQHQRSGGLAILENETKFGKRYIYYLVTKELSHGKPTYEDFWLSLKKMRDHIDKNEVKKLAIPKIGCGLDRLEWHVVKHMIAFLFRKVDVEILVCSLQLSEDSIPQKDKSCKVVFDDKPVVKIESGTIIIYFSTERGDIEEDAHELNKEFNFLDQFKKSNKRLGDAIRFQHKVKFYILYGCVVRKTLNDRFDFASFEKCLQQINKDNKKDQFYYVAYQSIVDKTDLNINQKIITLLRNILRNVDVYVCQSNRAGDISIEE